MSNRIKIAEPLINMEVGEQMVFPFSKLKTMKTNLYAYNNKMLASAIEEGKSWSIEPAKIDGKPVTLVTRIT